MTQSTTALSDTENGRILEPNENGDSRHPGIELVEGTRVCLNYLQISSGQAWGFPTWCWFCQNNVTIATRHGIELDGPKWKSGVQRLYFQRKISGIIQRAQVEMAAGKIVYDHRTIRHQAARLATNGTTTTSSKISISDGNRLKHTRQPVVENAGSLIIVVIMQL